MLSLSETRVCVEACDPSLCAGFAWRTHLQCYRVWRSCSQMAGLLFTTVVLLIWCMGFLGEIAFVTVRPILVFRYMHKREVLILLKLCL